MEVAARVAWSGAGIRIKGPVMPAIIKNKVRELLMNPIYKANAERIQADFMNYDAPENAHTLLERIIATSY